MVTQRSPAAAWLLFGNLRRDRLPREVGIGRQLYQHVLKSGGRWSDAADVYGPPRPTAAGRTCFSPSLYRDRNAIERMFSRIKDFRRIATRYDRLAVNFLAAVCLVATVFYWVRALPYYCIFPM
jgi:transposase